MIDFEALIQQEVVRLAAVAEARVGGHNREFAGDWEMRFGNSSLIGDESGVPGTVLPLHERTLDARDERGFYSDEPLYDPTMDHVATIGTIVDSIEESAVEANYGNKGDSATVTASTTTSHPLFPLNEYGMGVPARTTLLPSRNEVGTQFKGLMKGDIEAATGKKWTKRG